MVNFISLDPSKAGTSGLIWMLFSYGYALYTASNLIADGSELLLLVPSIAELVGSVVLPLLGAVPDGMIMLFSGLGPIKDVQHKINVGVGALAGSTIFLLTLNWGLCIFAGRVSLVGPELKPNYSAAPKLLPNLSFSDTLFRTGTPIHKQVSFNGIIMIATTVPYFVIQIPALFLKGNDQYVGKKEKWYALSGLIIAVTGFIAYMWIQIKESSQTVARQQRAEKMLKMIHNGQVSLSSAMMQFVKKSLHANKIRLSTDEPLMGDAVPPEVKDMLVALCRDAFKLYDKDNNGYLDKNEVSVLLLDMNDKYDLENVDKHFNAIDRSGDGVIDFDEFVVFMYEIIKETVKIESGEIPSSGAGVSTTDEDGNVNSVRNGFQSLTQELAQASQNDVLKSEGNGEEEGEEEEEIPEEFESLSVEEQQRAIKLRSFFMLAGGTALVIIFSDPMVGVFQEVSHRIGISAFYVSFTLAPLASNASEMISSFYYAKKKTSKTIAVSFKQLVGAGIMNNTFCLAIFMALIFFRGIAWNFTAETTSIVVVQTIIWIYTMKSVNSVFDGICISSLFPLSLALVAVMKHFGCT